MVNFLNDARKRKQLFALGIVVLALNTIVWTKSFLQNFLGFTIFGTIDIGTVIGIGVLYGVYLFNQWKLG